MKTRFFTLASVSLTIIAILAITGCEEDGGDGSGPNSLSNETIQINDSSAFNMRNFAISFEQMFVSSGRWAWDFDHDINNEGQAIQTYQNIKIFGDFGKKVLTITHNYNEEGIIVSSDRTTISIYYEIGSFEYEYDNEGFIVKLTKFYDGEIDGVVEMTYNEQDQLIQKTHLDTKSKVGNLYNYGRFLNGHKFHISGNREDDSKKNTKGEWMETFTYDSEGRVVTYTSGDSYHHEYTYHNNNMVETKQYENDVLVGRETIEYDDNNRMIKWNEFDRNGEKIWYQTIEYQTYKMIVKSFEKINGELMLESQDEYQENYNRIKSLDYYYNSGDFEYCIEYNYNEDNYYTTKSYYEGTLDNLDLIGYMEIDNRDLNNRPTKASFYTVGDSQLYYVEYSLTYDSDEDYWYIEERNWYTADGDPISENDITEEWVLILE